MLQIDSMPLPSMHLVRITDSFEEGEIIVKQVEKGKIYQLRDAPKTAAIVHKIVQGVNFHDALVQVLKDTLENLEDFLDEKGEFEWTPLGGRSVCRDIERVLDKINPTP